MLGNGCWILAAAVLLTCCLSARAADTRQTCSCAFPAAIPIKGLLSSPSQGVWLGNAFYSASVPSSAELAASTASSAAAAIALGAGSISVGAGSISGIPALWKAKTSGMCSTLPKTSPGGYCGAGIAICPAGQCCSQAGRCSNSTVACDGTCQCPYSAPDSKCKGSYPFETPNPQLLPVATPGGVCSPYTAVCSPGQCCSQFGFCVDDGSVYCKRASCLPSMSPWSSQCLTGLQSIPTRRYFWVVTTRTMAPDGFGRPVIVVNGAVMQPLNVKVGERIALTVTNKLSEPLSIHFHGMAQQGTPTMDGVPTLTQRPVMPNDTYTYNFIAATAGSYWWHSHYHTQYMDGLLGPLIVTDPNEPTYAADSVVAINDWYHKNSAALLKEYMSPSSEGNEPVPNSALINFVGQAARTPAAKNKISSYSLVKGVAAKCDSPFDQMGRIRIINSGGFAVFAFSVDYHRMIVIGEDGVLVEPMEIGSLEINNGQRYDVLLCQRPQEGKAVSTNPVFIRATMIDANFPSPSPSNTSLAVLYFTKHPPKSPPEFTQPVFEPPLMSPSQFGEDVVSPYAQRIFGEIAPPASTQTIHFDIDFYNEPDVPNATQYAHVNHVSLSMHPDAPSLLERYSSNPEGMASPTNVPSGIGWNIINIADAMGNGFMPGEVVDVVINNHDTGEHPIHLHGHWFWIMAAGAPDEGDYNVQIPLVPTLARDTVTVNEDSYLVLRFIADNPGTWIMHCHIDWHAAAGLSMLIREGFPVSAK